MRWCNHDMSNLKKKVLPMFRATTIAVALFAAASAVAASNTIRVMPLGDSITYGQGWDPHGGYRAVLREALTSDGYSIDYVGTQTANAGTLGDVNDYQHEGHPGWKIHQLTANMGTWSSRIDGPHAILLKIGTNDLGYDFDHAIDRMSVLLDAIERMHPSAHIFVATIIKSITTDNDEIIESKYNVPLRNLVAARAQLGEKLHLVDMFPLLDFGTDKDFADDRHPNDQGYRKMAAAWKAAFEAVFANPSAEIPEVTLTAVKATLSYSADEVTVSFNLPCDGESCAFTMEPAVEWKSKMASEDGRSVTLKAASNLSAGLEYSLAVSGIVNAMFSLSYLPYGAQNYVEEAKRYRKVYEIDLGDSVDFSNSEPEYTVDRHVRFGEFSRIAYYLELENSIGDFQYVWVSMDAFTDDSSKIAIPTLGSDAFFQQYVSNLVVRSNVASVTSGEKTIGNIEFWPWNYYTTRKLGSGTASDSAYDTDDSCNMTGNFGSMQVHDTAAGKPIFCFNAWGGVRPGATYDIGIGEGAGSNGGDWTQTFLSRDWSVRRHLEVYVLDGSNADTPEAVAAIVPDSNDYDLLYKIDLKPDMCINIATNGSEFVNAVDGKTLDAAHVIDNSDIASSAFSRVAYLLELVGIDGTTNWIWTAFDAFSQDYADYDIPTVGHVNGRMVSNLDVKSNVDGIVQGRGITTGLIEFSPFNYGVENEREVPNASGDAYDFGDRLFVNVGNYGCMQVHNCDADLGAARGQVLWAFNKFNGRDGGIAVGIGNCPGQNIDWTFASNASSYSSRTLYVFVLPDTPSANSRYVKAAIDDAAGRIDALKASWSEEDLSVAVRARKGIWYALMASEDLRDWFVMDCKRAEGDSVVLAYRKLGARGFYKVCASDSSYSGE